MGDHWGGRLVTERMVRSGLTEADCEEVDEFIHSKSVKPDTDFVLRNVANIW